MRVLTILVRFGTESYPRAERQLSALVGRQLPEVEQHLLVVDNALPRGYVETAGRRTLIGGDNTCREFSGFDRALEFIGHDIWRFSLVHFVTDAFHTLYVDYLDRFDGGLLRAIEGRSVCVGHIDCYNEPVRLLEFSSQHWIRTCFFFMPPAEARTLGSFVTIRDTRGFFSGDPSSPFRADAPASEAYRKYLIDWIVGQDIGQGVTWHSSFALGPDTLPAFERKAHSIMNEHLVSIRLRAMGCRLVDVTWLSTVLRHQRPEDVRWDTSWRDQLANRDQAALVVPT
jgi:hypothetical protein